MSRPHDPAVETDGSRNISLSIDEAAVLLGLLDLLQPADGGDPAVAALAERTRTRLAGAIAASLNGLRNLRVL